MDIKIFMAQFAELMDDMDVSLISPQSNFREFEDWSSIVALSLIAMVDEEYNVTIKGDDITNAVTVEDLYNVVQSKI